MTELNLYLLLRKEEAATQYSVFQQAKKCMKMDIMLFYELYKYRPCDIEIVIVIRLDVIYSSTSVIIIYISKNILYSHLWQFFSNETVMPVNYGVVMNHRLKFQFHGRFMIALS